MYIVCSCKVVFVLDASTTRAPSLPPRFHPTPRLNLNPHRLRQVLQNLQQRMFHPAEQKLNELRATDEADMNALHWAAGRNAEGSVEAAKAVLEVERSLTWRGFSYACRIGGEQRGEPERT